MELEETDDKHATVRSGIVIQAARHVKINTFPLHSLCQSFVNLLD